MPSTTLPTRRFGRTDLRVTSVGMGGWGIGRPDVSDETAVATILRALDLGVRLIDTSPAYGDSQRKVGRALRRWFAAGNRRDDLVISTKTGSFPEGSDYSGEATRRSVEKSLHLLGVDHIDVLLVHDPPALEPVFAPGAALDTLLQLKADGVIGAIGLGARPHEFHRRAIESGHFDVCLTFRDYNLMHQSAAAGVLQLAAAHDIAVLNGALFIWGILGGQEPLQVAKRNPQLFEAYGGEEEINRAQHLWQWCRERDVSLLALNLAYCAAEARISSNLLGAAMPSEIEADISALTTHLPPSVFQELHETFAIPLPGSV